MTFSLQSTSNWLFCTNIYIVVALHLADFCRYSNQDQSGLTLKQNTKLAGSVQIYALVNKNNKDSHTYLLVYAKANLKQHTRDLNYKNNCANRLIKNKKDRMQNRTIEAKDTKNQ